jgi:carbon storage regulator
MLVLTRKLMEKLYIGEEICVTVVRLEGGQVRLGIDAPRAMPVLRAELRGRAHIPAPDPDAARPGGPAGATRPTPPPGADPPPTRGLPPRPGARAPVTPPPRPAPGTGIRRRERFR